jgi:hypothetical protein
VLRRHAPVVVPQQGLPRLEVHASRSQSTAEHMLQVVHPNVPESLLRQVDRTFLDTHLLRVPARVATLCC